MDGIGFGFVEEVGPVWIGLHEAVLEEFAEDETEHAGADGVADVLGEVGEGADGEAVDEGCLICV